MEQKQLKMWLPSFLTWRAEHVLQKQAEMGYLLMAVENFGSFYTFSFESAPPLPRRFYVFRQDDIGKWGAHGRSPKEIAEEEISPYCVVQRSSNAATVTPLWRNYGRMYRMT